MAKGGYRGGFSGGSQANMMRQAQKMQQELLKMQQELETSEFEFTAGGGAVKAVVMGSRQLKAIEIDPDAVDPEDKSSQNMSKLQSGLNIPGLF